MYETNYKYLFIVSFVAFLGASLIAYTAMSAFYEASAMIQ